MISAAVTSRRIRLRLRAWRMTLSETGAKRPHWSAYSDATGPRPSTWGGRSSTDLGWDMPSAGHCCILGSCVASAYMGGQP
jgi:hypothetical protein